MITARAVTRLHRPTPYMGDLEAQRDELEILESIFGDLISFESENKIRISFDDDVRLSVKLPENYPSQEPPLYELSGPSLSRNDRFALEDALNATCLDNLGSPTIYAWISVIKEFLEARKGQDIVDSRPVNVPECFVEAVAPSIDDVPTIYHGEVFTDRKSHLQTHLELELAVKLGAAIVCYEKFH
ncbi:RWD domain protein [Cooperia oncophora]